MYFMNKCIAEIQIVERIVKSKTFKTSLSPKTNDRENFLNNTKKCLNNSSLNNPQLTKQRVRHHLRFYRHRLPYHTHHHAFTPLKSAAATAMESNRHRHRSSTVRIRRAGKPRLLKHKLETLCYFSFHVKWAVQCDGRTLSHKLQSS